MTTENNVHDLFENIDPKIGKAFAEIRATLEKYELGGFIQLMSQDSSEFATIFPAWSVAQMRTMPDGKPGLAMCVAKDDKRAVELGEQTIGLLLTMRDTCARQAMTCDVVMKQVAQHLDLDVTSLFGKSKASPSPSVQ